MAHYTATVTSPRPYAEVWQYMSDFRCVREWDPSITSVTLVRGTDPRAVGSAFRVVLDSPGPGDTEIEYEVRELAEGRLVVRGETPSLVSLDTITVVPGEGGTGSAVTYDAELSLKGVRKVADPVLGVGFHRASDEARDGLHAKLNP